MTASCSPYSPSATWPASSTPTSRRCRRGVPPVNSTVVVSAGENNEFDLYAVDTANGSTARRTDAPGSDTGAVSSPDGSLIN